MKARTLVLFCLFASPAHAQVGGRVTVGTLATRPTGCSAGDLYAASDTILLYQCGPANTWTAAPSSNGANSFTGNTTLANLNNIVFWDGVKYALTTAGLQSAINAACYGTIPGRVELPLTGAGQFVTMSATVTVPSQCTLNGPGKDRIVLQSSVSLNGSVM